MVLCCQKCFQVCSNQILQLSKNALEKCHTKTVTGFSWGLWPKINSVFFFLFKLYWPGHLFTANCLRCGSRDVYILTLKTWVGESCREKIRIGTTLLLQLAKYSMLVYRYWWNTRIFPFTKKIISSSCAVKILFLSFTCEDIGVAMITNIISQLQGSFPLRRVASSFEIYWYK